MLRLPQIRFTTWPMALALPLALSLSPAAQAQAPDEEDAPADVEETADDGEKADGEKADGDSADGEEGTPILRADGSRVLTDGSGFPLGINVSLSNSVGFGTFVPPPKFNPMLTSSVNISPRFMIPKIPYVPKLILGGGVGFNIAWQSAQTRGSSLAGDRILRVGDPSVRILAPVLYMEKFTKIAISGNVGVRLPLSLGSRAQKRIGVASAGLGFRWSTPKLGPVGRINFSYGPSLAAASYSQPVFSVPCGSTDPVGDSGLNPLANDPLVPLANPRPEQVLPDGTCMIPGLQPIAAFSQGIGVNWSKGQHGLNASFGYSIQFTRPDKGGDRGIFANGNHFDDSTSASFGYSYTVPIDTQLTISAGVSSGAATTGGQGFWGRRFPFYDLLSPLPFFGGFTGAARNPTSGYLSVNVGI